MTPESAVKILATLIAERDDFTQRELYAAMAYVGLPDPMADQAYKFTQIAWGRLFLQGLGIRFSPEYVCFDADGEIIDSGLLSDQPYYAAALSQAQRQPKAGFDRFATMSADVHAVDSALKSGSKPENLITGPAVLYTEMPTAEGLERAERTLSRGVSPQRKKPKWRFW